MSHIEYKRPRRPSPDTITYLKSLPLNVEAAAVTERNSSAETTTNNPVKAHEPSPMFFASLAAVYEIQHELASLAGDETSSEIIEILCNIVMVSKTATCVILDGIRNYTMHLSTHRYGSHVLQTILQNIRQHSKVSNDLALSEDAPPAPENLPDLDFLLSDVVQEMQGSVELLMTHLCGSHVLRSILCCLGGVQIVSNKPLLRRGKNKKKKKRKIAVHQQQESSTALERMVVPANNSPKHLEALQQLTDPILQSNYLQQWSCHASAAPVLVVLLQTWSYQNVAPELQLAQSRFDEGASGPDRHLSQIRPEPTFQKDSTAHQLVQRLLLLDEEQAGDVVFGMAGETRGSHVLENCLQYSSDSVFDDILQTGQFLDSIAAYVEHDVSQYVVQRIVSNLRNDAQVQVYLEALEPLIQTPLLENRRGILWRLVERVANSGNKKLQSRLLERLSAALNARLSTQNWTLSLPLFLNIQTVEGDSRRISMDVFAARTIYWLLKFHSTADVMEGILGIPQDDLVCLAKDPLGSRCILDGVLENGHLGTVNKLADKLQHRWVGLGIDRVGQHAVNKFLDCVSNKEAILEELSKGSRKLQGHSIGRALYEQLEIQWYVEKGFSEWSKRRRKKASKDHWLDDVVAPSPARKHDDAQHQQKKKHKTSVDKILEVI